MKAITLALLTVLNAQASGSKKPAPPEVPVTPADKKSPSESFERELLVSFKTPEAAKHRSELFKKHNVKELEKVGSTELYLVEVPEGADAKALRQELSKAEGVKYVEPNMRLHTMSMGSVHEPEEPAKPAHKPAHPHHKAKSHDVKGRK